MNILASTIPTTYLCAQNAYLWQAIVGARVNVLQALLRHFFYGFIYHLNASNKINLTLTNVMAVFGGLRLIMTSHYLISCTLVR